MEWQTECIHEMQRITKKFVLYNVQAILNNKNDVYRLIGNFADDIHMILIWYKPNAQPQHYDHRIANCYEMVLVIKGKEWNKKKFWLNTNGNKNVIVKNINSNREFCKEHRAVMNYDFAEEIIVNYTEKGDKVFDAFCGLADSGAKVNFSQGLDIRLMTEEKAKALERVKVEMIHFAWDRYEDKDYIIPKLEMYRRISDKSFRNLTVYVLVGDVERRVRDEDLERIYWLRDNGYTPYVMIYDKESLPRGHELKKLQRWVNNRFIFRSCDKFEDYMKG